MGAWDHGNFDNDTALDFVANISRELAREMRPPTEIADLDLVMAAVAMRKALVEVSGSGPERSEIETLRDAVLAVYDGQIDGLGPSPKYKIGRRRTIAETFDQFLSLYKSGSSK